jgi:hypothetical protein
MFDVDGVDVEVVELRYAFVEPSYEVLLHMGGTELSG